MTAVLAKIGHNQPPETPFDISKQVISDLYEEAKNWLDGEAIASQAQADEVQKLMRRIQAAEKEADDRRKEEARAHDEAKAKIQERYNELIGSTKSVTGMTVRAISACKSVLTPWLVKIDQENRRKAEEAMAEAKAKMQEALEAVRQRDGTDLGKVEAFEAAAKDAKEAEAEARRLGSAKARAKGEGRAVGLRDYYSPEITEPAVFARHLWTTHRSDMDAFLAKMAEKIVASGVRHGIPGVVVHAERKAV